MAKGARGLPGSELGRYRGVRGRGSGGTERGVDLVGGSEVVGPSSETPVRKNLLEPVL